MATTDRDEELVKYIDTFWKDQLDSSEIVEYEILLSFPSDDQINEPNVAEVYNETSGEVTFTTRTSEIVYNDYMAAPENIVPYFNAYAPAGDVTVSIIWSYNGKHKQACFPVNCIAHAVQYIISSL